MNYSLELKEALLRRMLPPNNESITVTHYLYLCLYF